MKRTSKSVVALLLSALCLSVGSFSVFAVDLDGDGYDDETGQIIATDAPVYTEPIIDTTPIVTEPIDTTPVYTDPVVTDPIYTEPTTFDPYYTLPSSEIPTYSGVVDYTSGYEDYTYQQEPTEKYIGGGQTYVEPLSTAPPAPLYNSREDIDDSELSDKDWKSIAAKFSISDDSNNGDSGSDDFSFIKNNDSKNDNGEWMLIVGIVCIVLSLAGIVYLIVSAVKRRKQLGGFSNNKKQLAFAGTDVRKVDDYDDGFGDTAKSSKFDTAEVKLPKGGSRYKEDVPKTGKRYK